MGCQLDETAGEGKVASQSHHRIEVSQRIVSLEIGIFFIAIGRGGPLSASDVRGQVQNQEARTGLGLPPPTHRRYVHFKLPFHINSSDNWIVA